MHFLYNIGIVLLGFGIRIHALFNPKSAKWISGRKGLFETLPSVENEKVIWFHCASLGEYDQGLPLMQLLRKHDPDFFILVTFFSPSGFEHYQKRDFRPDFTCYLPLDTPRNAQKFISHFKPEMAFFVKYEFWSNFIFSAKDRNTRIYNISGLFREDHRFFKWYGGYFRDTLRQFNAFYVQNERSKSLLSSISIENVIVTGDSRFDKVIETKLSRKPNEIIESFKNKEEIFVAGSTWPECEKLLIPWINNSMVKVLIAPHDISVHHVKSICSNLNIDYKLYSQATIENVKNARVLILDSIGLLSSAYAYGFAAYVGGGFSGKLHNILEPAVFGLPVIFGPKHSRFPEASAFIENGIAFSVRTSQEFSMAIDQIQKEGDLMRKKTEQFVEKNKGASEKIFQSIISN